MTENQIEISNKLAVAELMKKTLSTFFNNFWPILTIVLVVAVPVEFIKNYYFVPQDFEESFYRTIRREGLVGTVFLSLMTPSIVYYLHQKSLSRDTSIHHSFIVGLKKWPKIILYGFLKNIIITAGLIFFIVPGVIFFFRLLFVSTIITIEGTKGIDPIGKSRLLSKGVLWRLIVNVILLAIVVGISIFLIFLLIYWFLDGWIADTMVDIVADLSATLFTIQTLIIYLVLNKENLDEISAP